jgi:hypothetical protein
MEKTANLYTATQILNELSHLEKQIASVNPFKMDDQTKKIIGYYLNNRENYEDLMINSRLDEIGFELLQREINN